MKFLVLATVVAVAAAHVGITPVSLFGKAQDRITGEYIVQFRPDADAQFQRFKQFKAGANARNIKVHEFGSYKGFWISDVSEEELYEIQRMDGLATIEPNTRVTAFGEQRNPPYGLDRVDQREGLNQLYRWRDEAAGQGVGVYVLDTGIFNDHPDFNGRANFAADCYSLLGTSPCKTTGGTQNDPQGHGTHCAGTVGSTTYGVAKNATIFNIRVLSSLGTGSIGGIINGVEFGVQHAFNGVKIFSMSLGGGASSALDAAVDAAFAQGVLTIAATGNSNNDGCTGSPAGAREAVTVSATDRNDVKAVFSSYGPCVDLWAPGVDVESTATNGGTAVFSGTSMATPHVAGAAALIASRGVTSPAEIRDILISEGTAGVVQGAPAGTPNRLLFTNPL